MDAMQSASLADARRLVRELRALGHDVEVPRALHLVVLSELELGDFYFPIETPLGDAYVAYGALGITMVGRYPDDLAFERAFAQRFGRPVRYNLAPPRTLETNLRRELRGDRRASLNFNLTGLSEFERAVLTKALEIPRGQVRPYAWVAREIGNPKAVRAVGSALAHNPIPLFIPCHRVVRSDGQLGQYSLGSDENKRVMLAAEGVDPQRLEALARAGVRYIGSDTTHIYCFPTCRHGRRVDEAHRQRFHSEAEAAAAGYRPCKICRPLKQA